MALRTLMQSEDKYRLLIDNIHDGVFIIQDAKMQFVNKAFAAMTGYSVGEIIGMDFRRLVAPEDMEMVADRYKRRQAGEDVPQEYEFSMLHKDGKTRVLVDMKASIINYHGRVASMGTVMDITERKQAEQAIKAYAEQLEEANRMKELFTDIMHHDLINPLNTANGFIEILKENETDPQKKTYLEIVERNLFKSMDLIESSTRLSKLESSKTIDYEDMDLKNVIDDVTENFSQLAQRAGMEIDNNIKQCMPVKANKIIEEVFSNFISNAVKYASMDKRIVVNGEDGGKCWRLKVIDFGKGINDEDKKKIFERFRRMDIKGVKGSGLGLAIARKIVELHRGSIWVEDNPEGGAVFVVEIPKANQSFLNNGI